MPLQITWIGQSGFLLENGQGSLAIDPFCGQPQQGMERLYPPDDGLKGRRVDMVLASHPHWDHFNVDTYQTYIIPQTFLGPSSCVRALQASGCAENMETVTLNCGETFAQKGFSIQAVLADHDNDSIGAVVESNGVRMYFSGDTIFSSNLLMRNFGLHPDVMFICINGKYGNMHYVEAALYCGFQHTRFAIPAHHDMIRHNTENPNSFVEALKMYAPNTRGILLQRGQSYDLAALMEQNEKGEPV